MVTWVARQQCGLAPANAARLSLRQDMIVGVTKHHTGGAAPKNAAESRSLWRALQEQAMSGQNVNHTVYGDIEYNAGVDDFGQILEGRSPVHVGAHATSSGNIANRLTLGLAYLGSANPTRTAMEALAAYVFVVSLSIKRRALTFPHSYWSLHGGIVTDCPGPLLRASNP